MKPDHLQAALALWDYATRSASWALQDATGDPLAEQIHAALSAITVFSSHRITSIPQGGSA